MPPATVLLKNHLPNSLLAKTRKPQQHPFHPCRSSMPEPCSFRSAADRCRPCRPIASPPGLDAACQPCTVRVDHLWDSFSRFGQSLCDKFTNLVCGSHSTSNTHRPVKTEQQNCCQHHNRRADDCLCGHSLPQHHGRENHTKHRNQIQRHRRHHYLHITQRLEEDDH